MSHCTVCGAQLTDKFLKDEGMIPYCEKCGVFRFPMFNAAISAIVYPPAADKIILIQQYGRTDNILVAGYITKGESAEQALIREIREELGLTVTDYRFNASEYYEKSNTLMVNFACRVNSDSLSGTNGEIDAVNWYTPAEAKQSILHGSLAEKFLLTWFNKNKTGF